MKKVWQRWVRVTLKIASFQAGIVLTIIYFIFIVPLGFLLQVFFKQALIGHNIYATKNSYWMRRKQKHGNERKWAEQQ